jgi:hypothetical protein
MMHCPGVWKAITTARASAANRSAQPIGVPIERQRGIANRQPQGREDGPTADKRLDAPPPSAVSAAPVDLIHSGQSVLEVIRCD